MRKDGQGYNWCIVETKQNGNATENCKVWQKTKKAKKKTKNNRLSECDLLGTFEVGENSLVLLLETNHRNLKRSETN